jgi:hypothetical protein
MSNEEEAIACLPQAFRSTLKPGYFFASYAMRVHMTTTAQKQLHALPPQLRTILEGELHVGEQLLWVAQPDVRRSRRQGYWVMPFGAAILAFVVLGLPQISGDWLLMTVLLLCFGLLALLGLSFVAMPYLMQASAKTTVYAITTGRALILNDGKRDTLKSYPLRELGERDIRPRADGFGDLVLKKEQIKDSDGHYLTHEYGFFTIAKVHQVERLVDGLVRGEGLDAVLRRAALWDQFGHLL